MSPMMVSSPVVVRHVKCAPHATFCTTTRLSSETRAGRDIATTREASLLECVGAPEVDLAIIRQRGGVRVRQLSWMMFSTSPKRFSVSVSCLLVRKTCPSTSISA